MRKKIGLIRFPPSSSGVYQLKNFVEIIEPITEELYVVSNNEFLNNLKSEENIRKFRVEYNSGNNMFIRTFNRLIVQIKIARIIARQKDVNFWMAYGDFPIALPILFIKILNKTVVIMPMGSSKKTLKDTKGIFISSISGLIISYLYTICDLLLIYSENLISELSLEKHRNKIVFAHEHIIDFSKFNIKTPITKRDNIVGYVGRFSNEKNILNFLYSISIILKKKENIHFVLIGDGNQKEKVLDYIKKNNLNNKISNIGWISKEEMPVYLNKMKLLVIPSKTEGLPNIMLEAMACGTPVLASKVGSIPDIIKDGKNGFLLENTQSDCIADNILKLIDNKELNMIAENANRFVKENYTFEKTREIFMNIIDHHVK